MVCVEQWWHRDSIPPSLLLSTSTTFHFLFQSPGHYIFLKTFCCYLLRCCFFLSLASRRRIVSHSSLMSSVVLFPTTLMYESMSVCVCVGGRREAVVIRFAVNHLFVNFVWEDCEEEEESRGVALNGVFTAERPCHIFSVQTQIISRTTCLTVAWVTHRGVKNFPSFFFTTSFTISLSFSGFN